jgi:prepilin peptidase CpaA
VNQISIDVLVPAVLASLLAIASWLDFTRWRIPNMVVLPGMALAVSMHALLPSGLGFDQSLYGLALALGALLPPYFLRMLGAGDVKLMAMVGSFLGPREAFGAVLFTFLAGGVIAVACALKKGALKQTAHNVRLIFHMHAAKMAGVEGPTFNPRTETAVRIPYSVAIALGSGTLLILRQAYS